MKLINVALLFAAGLGFVSAQTYSKCNPMFQDGCPKNKALSGKFYHNFATSGQSSQMIKEQQGQAMYKDDGVHLRIDTPGHSGPQFTSSFYIMYGKVDVRMKTAPGAGIVSTVMLQSDTLDEVDFEFINPEPNIAQTNYFGNGVPDPTVEKYDRGMKHELNNHNDWHIYSFEWTPSSLKWFIDGQLVRELTPAMTSAPHHYPQSPMDVRVGIWAGGDETNNEPGTVKWAGGPTDFSKAPFDAVIEYISVEDYSTGKFYGYSDKSGKLDSIFSEGGKIFGAPGNGGSSPAPPPSSTKTFVPSSSTSTTKPPPSTTKSTTTPTPTQTDDDDSNSTESSASSKPTSTSTSSSEDSSTLTSSTTKSGFETVTTSKTTDSDEPTETPETPAPSGSVLPEENDSFAVSNVRASGSVLALVVFGLAMGWLL